jgi:hypothetical protein
MFRSLPLYCEYHPPASLCIDGFPHFYAKKFSRDKELHRMLAEYIGVRLESGQL